MLAIDVIKIFLPATTAFFIGIALTPLLTHYLYKYKAWKKRAGKTDLSGKETPVFNSLHKEKEVGTPRLGGIIIWVSAAITMLGLWLIAQFFPGSLVEKLEFFSRNQTWLPFAALLVGAVVGLIDDIFEIKGGKLVGGLSLRYRLTIVSLVALAMASWFFYKLDVHSMGIPFLGDVTIGWLFIPLFIFVAIAVYAGGVIDGIDGLSGGIFAVMFSAYAGIAFYQQQIDLAAFSAMIVGATLAFLWFNIPPARFYMSETGTMALTLALTVIAFTTDSLGGGYGVSVLPIIAFPLVITVLSNVIQLTSRKVRGKKVFLVAPLHHHFEAKGWPGYKVTMRYWVISVICALIGVSIALIG